MAARHYRSTWFEYKERRIQSLIDTSPIESDEHFRSEEDGGLYEETTQRLLQQTHQEEVNIYLTPHSLLPLHRERRGKRPLLVKRLLY
jgi:hypothetical protein